MGLLGGNEDRVSSVGDTKHLGDLWEVLSYLNARLANDFSTSSQSTKVPLEGGFSYLVASRNLLAPTLSLTGQRLYTPRTLIVDYMSNLAYVFFI